MGLNHKKLMTLVLTYNFYSSPVSLFNKWRLLLLMIPVYWPLVMWQAPSSLLFLNTVSNLYILTKNPFNSVQFSRSVVSDSLRPHESQHARPPCPASTPGVHSNSCLSSWWCHPAISSSVVPFSSFPQSLPASRSFPMSQLFTWGGQSIGVSALASFLPKNTQDWSPSEWTGWISLQSKESSLTPQFKSINSLALSFLHSPTLTSIHDHWENHSLD